MAWMACVHKTLAWVEKLVRVKSNNFLLIAISLHCKCSLYVLFVHGICLFVFLCITESIRQTLDEGSFSCGIFADLQKAFDTVDHKILLHKLEYYGIHGVCNDGTY